MKEIFDGVLQNFGDIEKWREKLDGKIYFLCCENQEYGKDCAAMNVPVDPPFRPSKYESVELLGFHGSETNSEPPNFKILLEFVGRLNQWSWLKNQ